MRWKGLLVLAIIFYSLIVFGGQSVYHTLVPIGFTNSNLPLLNIKLNEQNCTVVFDLGMQDQVALKKHMLDRLIKKDVGIDTMRDYAGRRYVYPIFKLSKLKIQNLSFANIIASETPIEFEQNTLLSETVKESREDSHVGALGCTLLQNKNLLFDFGHSRFFVSNDIKKLRKEGFDLTKYLKSEFTLFKYLLVVKVQTDFGPLRLALDTGASETEV